MKTVTRIQQVTKVWQRDCTTHASIRKIVNIAFVSYPGDVMGNVTQRDGENYDSQDRSSIAASRSKNAKLIQAYSVTISVGRSNGILLQYTDIYCGQNLHLLGYIYCIITYYCCIIKLIQMYTVSEKMPLYV